MIQVCHGLSRTRAVKEATATNPITRRIRAAAAAATPSTTMMQLLPSPRRRRTNATTTTTKAMTTTPSSVVVVVVSRSRSIRKNIKKKKKTTTKLNGLSTMTSSSLLFFLLMILNLLIPSSFVYGQQLQYVTYDFTGEMELAPISSEDNDMSIDSLLEWNDITSQFFQSYMAIDRGDIMDALGVNDLHADFIATDSIVSQINANSQAVTILFQAQISYVTSGRWNWDPAELILDVYNTDETFTNFVFTYRNAERIEEFQDVNSIGLRTQLPSIRNSIPYEVVQPTCIGRLGICEGDGITDECCDGYVCRDYLDGQPKICRDPVVEEEEEEETDSPTLEPTTPSPTLRPTVAPTTSEPTREPTDDPTPSPTLRPTTPSPTPNPTPAPTTAEPTTNPTPLPTFRPTTPEPTEPGDTPAPTPSPVVTTPSPTTANPTPAPQQAIVTNPSGEVDGDNDNDDDAESDGDDGGGGGETTTPSPTPVPVVVTPADNTVGSVISESGDDTGDDTTTSDNENVSSSLRGQGTEEDGEPKKEFTGIIGGIIIVGAFLVILIMGGGIGYYYYRTKRGSSRRQEGRGGKDGSHKNSTEKNHHAVGGFSAAASGNGLKALDTGGGMISYEEAYTNNFEIVVTPKTEGDDDDISELAGPFYPQDCDGTIDDEEKTYADKTVTDVSETSQYRELLCGGTKEHHPGGSELLQSPLSIAPREQQRIEQPMKSLLNLGDSGFGAFGFGSSGSNGKDTCNDDDNIFL